MAEYRPKNRGLERVLGTGALFSTAYGNVGSSIYYALGLVALYALGLTPVVFVIAGLIFACTAATYAEATTMFPEAGGSLELRPPRVQRVLVASSPPGGRCSTTSSRSPSRRSSCRTTSAVFWEPLRHAPADIIAGDRRGRPARRAQRRRRQGVGAAQRRARRRRLRDPGAARGRRHRARALDPRLLVDNVHLGHRADLATSCSRSRSAMLAYTGIETISNMAEEARDDGKTIPRGDRPRGRSPSFAIYFTLPGRRAVGAAGPADADGEYYTLLGLPGGAGRLRRRPDPRRRREHGPRAARRTPAEIYVGILAATILFIATNAGIIGVSRLVYSMGMHRQLPDRAAAAAPALPDAVHRRSWSSAASRCLADPARARPTSSATIYAFGAMLSFTIAHVAVIRCGVKQPDVASALRTGPGNIRIRGLRRCRCSRSSAASARASRSSSSRCSTRDVAACPASAGWRSAIAALRRSTAAGRASTLTETHKVAIPQPVVEHEAEYDSVLVAFEDDHYSPEAVATAVKLAARRRRGIHVLVTSPCRRTRRSTRRCPSRRRRRALDHRAGPLQRRPPRVRPLSSGCAPARRAGGSSRRPSEMRARARS